MNNASFSSGVELEYMIVDRDSLAVRPFSDIILTQPDGSVCAEYENGPIAWSNELCMHVIELKTNGPVTALLPQIPLFEENIRAINARLAHHHAMLLPTAAHPFMDPLRETRLWRHEYNEVYETYHRIFNCNGHGWSNVQSTHLNLGFTDDDHFGRLHAAIRLLLPIIPALAASSPVITGTLTGYADTRLFYYRQNQAQIPAVTGTVIPERAFTPAAYRHDILKKIYAAMRQYDPDGIVCHEWLNSRGAIARFERNTFEIRLIDAQECPRAEITVLTVFIAVLKALMAEQWQPYAVQKTYDETLLADILNTTITAGENAVIDASAYAACFGYTKTPCSAHQLWQHLFDAVVFADPALRSSGLPFQVYYRHGNLASRIVRALGNDRSSASLIRVYQQLAACLHEGRLFLCDR